MEDSMGACRLRFALNLSFCYVECIINTMGGFCEGVTYSSEPNPKKGGNIEEIIGDYED